MTTQAIDAPPIESVSELETLVSEVAELDAKAGQLDAEYKTERAKLETKYAEARNIKIGRGKQAREMTIEERRREILEAAHAFCQEHPDACQAGDKKSRNYPGGTLGYKKSPSKIVTTDSDKQKKVLQKWGKKIADWMSAFVPWKSQETITLDQVATVTIKPDMRMIEAQRKAGKLKPAVLGFLGMEYQEGQDEIFIDTKKRAVD